MRGHLFVAGRNQLDFIAYIIEGIQQSHGAMAADAEHIGDFLLHQKLCYQLSTLHNPYSVSNNAGSLFHSGNRTFQSKSVQQ